MITRTVGLVRNNLIGYDKNVKRILVLFLTLFLVLSINSIPATGVSFPEKAEVDIRDAPFLVSLWSIDLDTYERLEPFCSGVLIDSRTFLTAAHCLVDKKPFVVVTGQSKKSDRGEVLSVYDYRIHPRYSKSTSLNDIAVGILNFPSRYKSNIWENTKRSADFSKTLNQIFGWGLDQNQLDTGFPMSSRQIDFSKSGKKYFKGFNVKTQIAAGKLNKTERVFSGACFGDSGGPLIANNSGNLSVIGITSYISAKGCDVEIPTVFARVKYYIPFIQQTINSLVEKFNSDGTNFPALDLISLPANTDKYLTRYQGENTYYSSAQLQKGGGVSAEVDMESLMFQTYKASTPNNYDFRIGVYLTNPVETCNEKQKGSWLVQVALDSRQKIDFAFRVNPQSGCYTPDQIVYNAATILKTPPAQGVCNDIGLVPWSPDEKLAQTKTKIDAFAFYFFRPCLGTAKKIWIRIDHEVDGRGDIEPGYDMWAGPFSAEIPGEESKTSELSSYSATLDKASYRIGEVAYLTITGRDSSGVQVGSGVQLSKSDLLIDFSPHIFRVTPRATDVSINGKWIYELIISSTEGIFSGKVKIGNLQQQLIPYGVVK